ncbi:MAG: GNAT family N-acetyltransferase [Acidiferrobacterales bacterium]
MSDHDITVARHLFEQYAAWLGVDLSFQSFDTELAGLPGPYARPGGVILLAEHKRIAVGCVALRSIGDHTAEAKRLFVVPAYRGRGLGRQLMNVVIAEAKQVGYARIWLDTIPMMTTARVLYESLGFEEIAPYYHNPIDGTVYMELVLDS